MGDAEGPSEPLIVLDTHALALIEKDEVIVTDPVGLPECDVVSLENFEGDDEGVAHAVDETSADNDLQAVALMDEVIEADKVRFAEGVEVIDAVTAMLGDRVVETEGDLDSRGELDDETVFDGVGETEMLEENENDALREAFAVEVPMTTGEAHAVGLVVLDVETDTDPDTVCDFDVMELALGLAETVLEAFVEADAVEVMEEVTECEDDTNGDVL